MPRYGLSHTHTCARARVQMCIYVCTYVCAYVCTLWFYMYAISCMIFNRYNFWLLLMLAIRIMIHLMTLTPKRSVLTNYNFNQLKWNSLEKFFQFGFKLIVITNCYLTFCFFKAWWYKPKKHRWIFIFSNFHWPKWCCCKNSSYQVLECHLGFGSCVLIVMVLIKST